MKIQSICSHILPTKNVSLIFSTTATQLANRLNNLTNYGTRNYKNSESLKNNLNSAQLDTLRSVNLLRIKELRMEDLSTLSMDFLSSKCTKCKFL